MLKISMRFSDQEIELAREIKQAGLQWEPTVGNYVYDEHGLIEVPSPFQEKVYFILDLKHFLRRSETLENLTEKMIWLPAWEQAREILSELNVNTESINETLQMQNAFNTKTERLILYKLILAELHEN